jgi:hypothetical protein
MQTNKWVEFELAPSTLGHPVSVRLSDLQARWLAVVQCGAMSTNGLGATAREALLAAFGPLGQRATAILMADPAMFAASASLVAAKAAV